MKAKSLAFENETARKQLTGPFYTLSRVGSQTLARIKMKRALSAYTLRGKVVDIGGGHSPDYFDYFSKEPGVQVDKSDRDGYPICGVDKTCTCAFDCL